MSAQVDVLEKLQRWYPSLPVHPGWQMSPHPEGEWVLFADVQALRQQPAPVDLEQFREIAEGLRLADQFFDGDDSHWQWDDGEFFPASKVRAAHKRLLALIDNAGKVGHQPAPVVDDAMVERALSAKVGYLSVRQLFACEREARQGARAILTAAAVAGNWIAADDRELNAGRLKALHRGLELARKWSAGTGTHGHTDRMVRDMADELRSALSSQDGDYAHQPAPVVDDELPGMWSQSDFMGGAADAADDARQLVPSVDDAMVDRYLAAQAKAVQEIDDAWGNGGKAASYLHPVREACRAGLTAALTAALARAQPAPVVDDAMVDAAIAAQDAHWANDDNYPARAPRSVKGDAALHDKLARGAMRAALTAALARAQGVQS